MSTALLAVSPWAAVSGLMAQGGTEVRLTASDGVELFADLYGPESENRPLVLLFHQGGSDARGEYGPLVPRLLDMGYSALALDARRGGDRLGGVNRTVERLGQVAYSYCDALADLDAALSWARHRFPGVRPVLWGSSYSAALVFHLAAARPDEVSGVLAFSPASGEPMDGCQPESVAAELEVPALVLRPESEAEIPRIAQQLEAFARQGHRTWVARPGTHGSSMLNPARVDGDVEATWSVVADFLGRIAPTGGG